MRDRKIKLKQQLHASLREKYSQGYGHKKHEIKDEHNSTNMIHSTNTYKTYNDAVRKFADWCKTQNIKDMDTAKTNIPQYMEHLKTEGYAASTMSTKMNGICKAFGIRTTDVDYKLPQRKRSDIVRSRDVAARDKHFSPSKNKDLIKFCESTGLRRRELEALKGSDLVQKGDKTYLHVQNGKGGKKRYVEVLEGGRSLVRNMCERAGTGNVFPRVHSDADIHFYRGNYAKALYHKYARDLKTLDRSEKYYCRGDMKGKIYDRQAMAIASKNLGHERISVIAGHYLY